jgi:hypothetical protein
MVGDSVNDARAPSPADIGVGEGIASCNLAVIRTIHIGRTTARLTGTVDTASPGLSLAS